MPVRSPSYPSTFKISFGKITKNDLKVYALSCKVKFRISVKARILQFHFSKGFSFLVLFFNVYH